MVCWAESEHVGHLRRHPAEYEAATRACLEAAKNAWDGASKREGREHRGGENEKQQGAGGAAGEGVVAGQRREGGGLAHAANLETPRARL